MSALQAVGIDLGTTYSCLSHLTPQGQPVTLANAQGELATPSVVLFDGQEVVVGTEALRNAVAQPERVVQNAKRFMGDPHKSWVVDGKVYRPADISALILRYLLQSAEEQLGPIQHAVITVPAQFSDRQRQDTIEAGHMAGLDKVALINEPVAAALCYVLGSEGTWFSELAESQTIMVYDLGGGTFDLSLVRYDKNAVNVVRSAGDLHLGGIDWNAALETYACDLFIHEIPDDPRLDRQSMQALANDVEQCKRALSVRPQASVSVVHAGRHKTYPVTLEKFEELTASLVERTERITIDTVKQHSLSVRGAQAREFITNDRPGWQDIDAILITGGASRMPMVRNMLKRISGTTLNTSLSPDQSICRGAAYYAGMLHSNQRFAQSILASDVAARLAMVKQRSVNARALGVLVKDRETGKTFPHYVLPANTPLPCEFKRTYGTVIPNQKRVHVHIVESGTTEHGEPVELGACVIDELPPQLPAKSPIEITIRYDEQARVHVAARDVASGKTAHAEIVREENLVKRDIPVQSTDVSLIDVGDEAGVRASEAGAREHKLQSTSAAPTARGERRKSVSPSAQQGDRPSRSPKPSTAAKKRLETADRPIVLCNTCGEPLDIRGRCPAGHAPTVPPPQVPAARTGSGKRTAKTSQKPSPLPAGSPRTPLKQSAKRPPLKNETADDENFFDIDIYNAETEPLPKRKPLTKPNPDASAADEDEFWNLVE
ncbi:MAG: Hsp70 family protein [Planctomycetaceae bacterium]|nr:Hsp70 family protein [Planctomycetaceae bacterium]